MKQRETLNQRVSIARTIPSSRIKRITSCGPFVLITHLSLSSHGFVSFNVAQTCRTLKGMMIEIYPAI